MSKNLSAEIAGTFIGNSTAKLVLRCLADFADDDGSNCFPTIAAISVYVERDRKTVFRALKTLKEEGWIRTQRRKNSSSCFSFNFEKINNAHKITKEDWQSGSLQEDVYSETDTINTGDKKGTSKIENTINVGCKSGTSNTENLDHDVSKMPLRKFPKCLFGSSKNVLFGVAKTVHYSVITQSLTLSDRKEPPEQVSPCASDKSQNSVETLHSKNLNPNITAENQTSRLAQENLSLTKGKQGISVSTVESVPATESSPLSFGEGEKINPCDAPQNPSLTKKSVNDIADMQTNPVVTETTQPTVSCVGHGVSNEKQASSAQTASFQSTSRTNSKQTDADCLSGDLFGFMEDSAPNRESVTSVRTIQGSYELPHPETKKMVKIEADFVRTEKPEEVSLEVWNDFIAFRRKKGKKSYITDGLIEKYSSIARQAGFSLEAVIQNCIDRDWQGINDAKWLLNSPPKPEGYTADFQYWKDFCFNCADKRKPMTKTRVEAFKQKVAQSGVSLNDAVQCCAEKGYADFVYPEYLKWLSEHKGTNFGYKRFSAQSESQNGSPNNTNNVPTGSIFRWFASKSA